MFLLFDKHQVDFVSTLGHLLDEELFLCFDDFIKTYYLILDKIEQQEQQERTSTLLYALEEAIFLKSKPMSR